MKAIIITLVIVNISFTVSSQDFEVPKNYKLEKVEDYAIYEQDIINSVNWLLTTPIDEQVSKRKEVNQFLLKWLTGSPNVSIEIQGEIVTFMGTSPELLMVFMGAWAKYSLETKDFDDKVGWAI